MESIQKVFEQDGYVQITTNLPNPIIYIKRGQEDSVVLLFDMPMGTEFSFEQYKHIRERVSGKVQREGIPLYVYIFLYTGRTDMVKEWYQRDNEITIIDPVQGRLLSFEGTSCKTQNLRNQIEWLLQKEDYSDVKSRVSVKRRLEQVMEQVGWVNGVFILLNIFIFIGTRLTGTYTKVIQEGALSWYIVKMEGQYYRLLTSMFLHGGIDHLFNNMLILGAIGGILERRLGKIKYFAVYIMSGIVAGMVSMRYNMEKVNVVRSIGASGAIFGIIGGVLLIVLVNKGHVENLSKRQVLFFALLSLYGGFVNQGVDNAAHVGGLIAGMLFTFIVYRKPKERGIKE